MSGHSKWKNIMHKKEKTDAQRAKIFTKIGREITLCVKEGGPDPASNAKLKDLISKAKENNVPNDNIERVIKKASGDGCSDNYEEIQYEGYGPKGVAVIVETLTDNRQFTEKGVIVIDKSEYDENKLMEDILDADVDDYAAEEEVYEVYTSPDSLPATKELLENKGYKFLSAEVEKLPSTYITLSDEDDVKNMQKLLDILDDDDDVQNVWHNWDEK